MKVEWLFEAQAEYRNFLLFYKTKLGTKYAEAFAEKIRKGVRQLSKFPDSGVLRKDTLMGKYGFRALFIDQYVCVYKIEGSTVFIYHLADGRSDYIYHIFGME